MKIKIKDIDVELNFGVGFLRSLDSVAGMKANGVSFGMSLTQTIPNLKAYEPLALFNVIYSATSETEPRPGQKDIEEYFNGLTDTQIGKLFDDTEKELKKSAMIRFTINRLNKESNGETAKISL